MTSLAELNLQVESYLEANPYMMSILVIILIWKLVWYGLALYQSIQLKQKPWFVVLFLGTFVLNDLGILPIIYLIIYRDKNKQKNKKSRNSKKPKGGKNAKT
jgi:hypothetical protein